MPGWVELLLYHCGRNEWCGADDKRYSEKGILADLFRFSFDQDRVERPEKAREEHPEIAYPKSHVQKNFEMASCRDGQHSGNGDTKPYEAKEADSFLEKYPRQNNHENRCGGGEQGHIGRVCRPGAYVDQRIEKGDPRYGGGQHGPLVLEDGFPILSYAFHDQGEKDDGRCSPPEGGQRDGRQRIYEAAGDDEVARPDCDRHQGE